MKKFSLIFAFLSLALVACGASRTEIQATSSELDALIEVRYMQEDTVALMVGNSFYINTSQVIADDIFPMLASVRDPMNIERVTPIVTLNSPQEFVEFIRKNTNSGTSFGLVIGGNVSSQIGFDESEVIEKMKAVLQTAGGGTLVLFHEDNGELIDMKRLY